MSKTTDSIAAQLAAVLELKFPTNFMATLTAVRKAAKQQAIDNIDAHAAACGCTLDGAEVEWNTLTAERDLLAALNESLDDPNLFAPPHTSNAYSIVGLLEGFIARRPKGANTHKVMWALLQSAGLLNCFSAAKVAQKFAGTQLAAIV